MLQVMRQSNKPWSSTIQITKISRNWDKNRIITCFMQQSLGYKKQINLEHWLPLSWDEILKTVV